MKQGHERPIDSVAARVVSRGESFEYRGLSTEICSSDPLPMRTPSDGAENLSGVKFGRLTVLAPHLTLRKRWVCKCLCGNYVVRRVSTIKGAPIDSACQQCYLMAVSKKNEFMRRAGIERHTAEFLK